MQCGRKVTVTVLVPSGGETDSYTSERVSGGSVTSTSVDVLWLDAPDRRVVIERGAPGGPLGFVQAADAQLLYQRLFRSSDLDWHAWIRPDVIVQHGGREYVPVSIAENTARGWQLVGLRLREGAQA
ncbi:MAG: hypothetical protein ACE15D_18720 [Candidatus Eisenbacteria bacterium]